jgi:hypothetical protein
MPASLRNRCLLKGRTVEPKPEPPPLKLETTEQYLSMPLVGAHDNEQPSKPAVDRCVAQLVRISGH